MKKKLVVIKIKYYTHKLFTQIKFLFVMYKQCMTENRRRINAGVENEARNLLKTINKHDHELNQMENTMKTQSFHNTIIALGITLILISFLVLAELVHRRFFSSNEPVQQRIVLVHGVDVGVSWDQK